MAIRWRERRWLRVVVKAVCGTALPPIVLLGLLVARSYFGRTTEVFLVVPFAKMTLNGQKTTGWVHRGVRGGELCMTFTALRHHQSYLLDPPYENEKNPRWQVFGYGTCRVPRFPVFTLGDYVSSCADMSEEPERRLILKRGFVAFDADDGSRVTVRW